MTQPPEIVNPSTRGSRIRLHHARRDRTHVVAAFLVLVAPVPLLAPWWPVAVAKVSAVVADPGEVDRVRVPAAGVDAKVVQVGFQDGRAGPQWEVADFAVGHHVGSGVPGQGRTVVLAGHNNTRGEVFRHLDDVRVGDAVEVRAADGTWHGYVVSDVRLVLEEGASGEQRRRNAELLADVGEERLVLVTCWPYRPDPPYRLVVTAVPRAT